MKTSESISKIAPALLQAQRAIGFAAKGANNPHFKSKYADLPAVIDAVKGPLNEAGIIFIQSPAPSDDGKLHLTTRLIHESGEWIESTAVTPLQKSDPQGVGSAITYMRRYSLAAITGLYQDDDDGNAASGVGQQQHRQQAPQAKQAMKPVDVKRHIAAIKGAKTGEALKAAFAAARTQAAELNDEAAFAQFQAAKQEVIDAHTKQEPAEAAA
jgi:hypothetical protein